MFTRGWNPARFSVIDNSDRYCALIHVDGFGYRRILSHHPLFAIVRGDEYSFAVSSLDPRSIHDFPLLSSLEEEFLHGALSLDKPPAVVPDSGTTPFTEW